MNAIVDHFGTKVLTEEIDDNHFKATVTVSLSPTFYRWVFGWNGAMKILGPESVKAEYQKMLMNSLESD
jgi:predicted DNA-binding transcriptional regulator YafY